MPRYRVVDSDGHVLEPESMWPRYLEERFHGMAPGSSPTPRAVSAPSSKAACSPTSPATRTPAPPGGARAAATLAPASKTWTTRAWTPP